MPFRPFENIRGLAHRRETTAIRAEARIQDQARTIGAAATPMPTAPHVGATVMPAILSGVEAYWRNRIGSRRVPLRSDIDPAGIAPALPATMILERVAPGIARIRVAGQQIEAMCGLDPRGMPLSVFFAPESRDYLGAHVEAAFAGPAIVSLELSTARRLLRRQITGRLLILPLDDGTGLYSRALAVIATTSDVSGQAPARFGIPTGAPVRCDVMPAPPTMAEDAGAAVRTEPTVAMTQERRRLRTDLRKRYRLFEVVEGHSKASRLAARDDTGRPDLRVVGSDA